MAILASRTPTDAVLFRLAEHIVNRDRTIAGIPLTAGVILPILDAYEAFLAGEGPKEIACDELVAFKPPAANRREYYRSLIANRGLHMISQFRAAGLKPIPYSTPTIDFVRAADYQVRFCFDLPGRVALTWEPASALYAAALYVCPDERLERYFAHVAHATPALAARILTGGLVLTDGSAPVVRQRDIISHLSQEATAQILASEDADLRLALITRLGVRQML